MRRDELRTILAVGAAGIVVAVLALPALYFLGLWMTPRPRPTGHRAAPRAARDRVLKAMHANRALDAATLDRALQAPLVVTAPPDVRARPPC